MDVYVVITEDRHTDTDVAVFTNPLDAVAHAEAEVAGTQRSAENIEDSLLTSLMIADGWLAYLPYGAEGDNVRVLRRELLDRLK